jgi:magnesium transporter
MNFSTMPELGWMYGYPAVLLFMGAVAGGMMWVFKRRGWFD